MAPGNDKWEFVGEIIAVGYSLAGADSYFNRLRIVLSPPLKRAGDQAQPGGGLSCGFPRAPLSKKSASNRHPQANHPPLTRSPFLFKEGQKGRKAN